VTFTTEKGLPDNKLRDLVVDKKGDLWIATRGGLSHYSRGKFRNYTEEDGLINNRVQSLSLDQKGHLWIGTEEGASYFDGSNFTSYQVEQGLPNNFIYTTLYDREGNIWFGTFGGGITMFLGDHIHNYTVEEGLPNNVITSITQSQDGTHWITTYGGGLSRFNGTSFKTYNERDGLVENKAYQVIADSKNRLLIGTRWGLSIFNGSSFRNLDEDELPYRKIRALREDVENGIYWLGTYGEGVLRYDGNKFEQFTEQDGLANNTVLGVELAGNGDVWFATYGGASRYRNGTFTNITVRDGLPNNGVLDILYDGEGRLWFATFNGLALYSEEEGIITTITPRDGFPNEVCYFILQDHEGIYWVGTNKGVVRFDYDTYKALGGSDDRTSAFKLITQNQGLAANEMNAGAGYKDRDGMLWFGSVGGLTRFNPYLAELNQAPPIVHIESVRVSGETVPFENGLEIGSDNHNLTFDFIGINLTAPDQVVYEYRLKGSGETWQRTKQRSVRYSKLFPGEYTFQVRAHNSDGVWSTQTASIRITILAPFWLQWWFIAAIVLGICGIIFFIYHYYKVRKMVEIERMRVRIASDLHDDVGSALTEIALQSDFLQTSEADGEVKNSLRQIGAQSRKIVSSLDDIVWSIDARNDTLGDLTDRMQDYASNVLPTKDIMYQFDGLDMEEKLTVPMKENLYLIFKEAINNIAKHSNASQVEVSLKNKNHSFDLVIRDNGSARKRERKTGHGLRNIRMRAERIRAEVEFKNSSGFTVHVHGEK
jgi:two-component sensor histidine kinase/streptogramin lyase